MIRNIEYICVDFIIQIILPFAVSVTLTVFAYGLLKLIVV
jgi:hypothetical protein